MTPEFRRLIEDYIATVAKRFAQLQRYVGVALPSSNVAWAANGMEKKGTLSDGASYLKHGYGCLIESKAEGVDFDFGDQGEIDGFDACRLAEFVGAAPSRFSISEERMMKPLLDAALTSGEIVKRGRLYYMKRPANQALQHNDPSCHVSCLRTPRASRGRG